MSPELEKCEATALKLTPHERALLAEHLISSLDGLSDSQNEELWLEEADRRYREYKKGAVSTRPAGEVIRDARASIA